MLLFIQTVVADEDSEALDRALARAAEAAAATEAAHQEVARRRPEVEARAREVEVLGEQLRTRVLRIVDWQYSYGGSGMPGGGGNFYSAGGTYRGWGVAGPDGLLLRMDELSAHLGGGRFADDPPDALVQDVRSREWAGAIVAKTFNDACTLSTLSRGGCLAEARRGTDPCWVRQGSRGGWMAPVPYLGGRPVTRLNLVPEGSAERSCVAKAEGGGVPPEFDD